MFNLLKKLMIVLLSIYLGQVSAKSPLTFPTQVKKCFPLLEVKGYPEKTEINYAIVTEPEFSLSKGDIFIVAYHTERPTKIWIKDENRWTFYDLAEKPLIYTSLSKSIPSNIDFYNVVINTDFRKLDAEWMLAAGYGIRESDESTTHDAFMEMLVHKRYQAFWGNSGGNYLVESVCMESKYITFDSITFPAVESMQEPIIVPVR